MKIFSLYLKGFAMGIADIVPGISGGTIALIVGIYEELITALSRFDGRLLQLVKEKKIIQAAEYVKLAFIASVVAGILSAILILARLMNYLLLHHATLTWSFFFGLILSSILFLLRKVQLKCVAIWPCFFIGVAGGYAAVSLVPVQTPDTSAFIFLSGAIAICAMILPGVSGAFLLLIMGKYEFITGMLRSPITNILQLIIFVMGCLVGLLSFSKLIKWALSRYHDLVLAILTGFIAGSIKKIWPWRTILESRSVGEKTIVLKEGLYLPEMDNFFFQALAFFILGFIIVQLFDFFENRKRGVSSAG